MVLGEPAFRTGRLIVIQPVIGECAANHPLMIRAAGPLNIEISRRDAEAL